MEINDATIVGIGMPKIYKAWRIIHIYSMEKKGKLLQHHLDWKLQFSEEGTSLYSKFNATQKISLKYLVLSLTFAIVSRWIEWEEKYNLLFGKDLQHGYSLQKGSKIVN